MPATTYEPVDAGDRHGPAALAAALIPKYHPHLADARMGFVWRSRASERGAHVVLGKAARAPAHLQALAGVDFVLEFAADRWATLDDAQRLALVDHELCHCGVDVDEQTGAREWVLVDHDLEEFSAVVQRHGLWKSDLRSFVAVAGQDQRRPCRDPDWERLHGRNSL